MIWKDLMEKLWVRHIEATGHERMVNLTLTDAADQSLQSSGLHKPAYSLPLQEIDVLIGGKVMETGVIDPGLQIIVMQEDLAQKVGATINTDCQLQMEGVNGATNWTLGCAEYLPMCTGDIPFLVHAHAVQQAPFQLLLGQPFQHALLCRIEDLPGGDIEVSVQDPADSSHHIVIPSRPCKTQVASARILTLSCRLPPLSLSQPQSPTLSQPQPLSLPRFQSLFLALTLHSLEPSWALSASSSNPLGDTTLVQAYKKVAKKVRPVPASLPEDFRIIHCIPSDPLLTLPALPPCPPDFVPGTQLTQEHLDVLGLNQGGFLWPEELKLLQHVLKLNELGLAWTEAEKGHFRDDYFSPVKIPVIEHIPWVHRSLPILPGILDEVIQIFHDKFAAGVYEHSDASYRSPWFCVKKKNGSLHIVHDLQPLNVVMIQNSGISPLADQLIESMAGRSCYTMLDLFVGYDHHTLDVASRDLTTFQSPIGTVRLTTLPMGWTNTVAIFHEDVTFLLEPEIPHVAWPFVDDCSIKGPPTRFETKDSGYETLPDNPGICKFIWQHLLDVHRILHRLRCAGATVSAKKLSIAVPEVVILGHKCNYKGHVLDNSKIARIRDWPTCKSLTDVRAFLGTAGFMRIWIKNYLALACPLVNLTRKGQPFVWTAEQDQAMQALKDAIIHSPTLISIDYSSNHPVYVGIDSSSRGVGWILSQECADNKHRPAWFRSISWNEREAHYSQPKIELYSLFRVLRALRVHLIGVNNLIVEMDAQFVKGMLHNPDIQPNATINRWIMAILLFDFKLAHVPAAKHHGPDGLSHREPAEGEEEEDDPEDWINRALSLGLWVSSWLDSPQFARVLSLPYAPAIDNSASDNLTEFPISEKGLEAEEPLAHVEQYLHSLRLPPELDDKTRTRILRLAAHFFLLNGRLWQRQGHGRHQLYIPPSQRLHLIREAHDNLGHKGFYSMHRTLLDCFWWPTLQQDVKWFIKTCHQCQLRQTTKVRIPPTVALPAPLFRKAYIDTMYMPLASGFRFIVQARCSLTAWPEWHALRSETGRTLGSFIFEELLCHWGAIEEIVTDNGTAYVAMLDWLANKYGIHHIHISAYNSQANGIVE
jgi:integrase-like protein/reverse transcriptase-like protein